jgi:hypothetical protein
MTTALLFGFAFFFVVEFVRALPWPTNWKHVKPLSCSTCMVGWCVVERVVNMLLSDAFSIELLFGYFAAAGIARMLLAVRAYFEPELPPT